MWYVVAAYVVVAGLGYLLGRVLGKWRVSCRLARPPMWFWYNGKHHKCFQFAWLDIDMYRRYG